MPEVRFHVRWPDQTITHCYSPSRVIKEYLAVSESYLLADFVQRSRDALQVASDRVRQKYGMGCGHAMAQLAEIEEIAARFAPQSDARVTIEAFEE
jgi:uncharacterized repeat protein (TIGR04042 family)